MEQPISLVKHYERGLMLKQVKLFDQAIDEFQQASRDPQQAGKANVQIALCLRTIGRQVEAVAAFREALTSALFSAIERLHILYLLGQTLESLGRYAETLEVYRLIRDEDPGFQDVVVRIKNLGAGGRHNLSSLAAASVWVNQLVNLWGQLRPQLMSLLGHVWAAFGRQAKRLETSRWAGNIHSSARDIACRLQQSERMPKRPDPSAALGRSAPVRRHAIDKRLHARVQVQMRSQFSSKTRGVAGQGELRDLSPWGCRVKSPVGVPVGVELECCIFPQDQLNPFTVEGATVRWSRSQEFGVAFTKIRPGVQRQIEELCRPRAHIR